MDTLEVTAITCSSESCAARLTMPIRWAQDLTCTRARSVLRTNGWRLHTVLDGFVKRPRAVCARCFQEGGFR